MPPDYYHILGVARTCTPEELKRSYRRLARRYHPDVCKEPDAEERFKEISEAYAVLADPDKRRRYDTYGEPGLDGFRMDGGFGDFFDIFNQVFGGFGPGFGASEPARGADLEYELTIDLATVVTGWETELEVQRQAECERCSGSGGEPGHDPETCEACGGSGVRTVHRHTILGMMTTRSTCSRCRGRGVHITHACRECSGAGVVSARHKVLVQVPAGIASGQRILHAGQGDVPAGGGVPGDLYVRVMVKPDRRFQRRDRDLIMQLDLSFAQAALGDVVTVPTVDGEQELTIPAGAQHGDALKIPGAGLPPLHGGQRGNQIVGLRITTPQQLTDRERELLEELARERGEQITPQPHGKGIFERIREVLTGEG